MIRAPTAAPAATTVWLVPPDFDASAWPVGTNPTEVEVMTKFEVVNFPPTVISTGVVVVKIVVLELKILVACPGRTAKVVVGAKSGRLGGVGCTLRGVALVVDCTALSTPTTWLLATSGLTGAPACWPLPPDP